MFYDLWRYRHFIISSIRNDLVGQFARSKLGGFWVLINPLSQVLIYALIFSNVLSAKIPGIDDKYAYSIYLMAGLLAWNLFFEIVNRNLNLFVSNGNLMKKVSFPRVTLPVIAVGASLLNNVILFIVMLGIFLALGHSFSWQMIMILPLMLMVSLLAVGVGLILGVLNVFVRDLGQAIPIVLQVWFWFTPIVYPVTIIPEEFGSVLEKNPIYPFVKAYQDLILHAISPSFIDLIAACVTSLLILFLSLFVFRRASAEMVDAL